MTISMTAFARAATQQEWGQAVWEVRAVNHRYLDLSFRVPDVFRQWESAWRQLVGRFVQRGKIECHLDYIASENRAPLFRLNQGIVTQLLSHCQHLFTQPGIEKQVNAFDILRFQGVMIQESREMAELKAPITTLFEETLTTLLQMRQQEGALLQQTIESRLAQVKDHVNQMKAHLPACRDIMKQKLLEKCQALTTHVDPERLDQEVVLLVQRSDIAEEIDRLFAHIEETARTLNQGGAVGRRLDFLMQEMNREANTLAAKVMDNTLSKHAIELKVLIEQMREQIQNME